MKRLAAVLCFALAALPARAADPDYAVLFERGQFRRAAAAAERAVAADPADAAALAVLARVQAAANRYREAVAFGERAVKAAPRSAAAHYALAEAQGRAAQSGGMLKGLGAARAFKREAEAALALDPNHTDAIEALMEFHRLAPGIVGGDKKKRAELAARLAAVKPEEGWFQQARDALRERDTTKADQCWRKAAEVAPASPDAKLALAQWLAGSNRDVAGAERLALAVTAEQPWRASAWQLVVAIQAHGRRWSELEATLARSESALEGRRDAWYQAGRQMVTDKSDPVRAEKCFRYYLEREPEIGAPGAAPTRWRIGLALEQQGRKAEALAEVQAATRLDPDFEPAKADLKRLKGQG